MARLHEIRWRRAGADHREDRGGAVRGGDPGRDFAGGVDGDGELGALRLPVVADHQLQPDSVAPFAGHRQADQAATVPCHEVDRLRCRVRGRHHEIALVLTVLVVNEHHHAAVSELGDEIVYGVESHGPGVLIRAAPSSPEAEAPIMHSARRGHVRATNIARVRTTPAGTRGDARRSARSDRPRYSPRCPHGAPRGWSPRACGGRRSRQTSRRRRR